MILNANIPLSTQPAIRQPRWRIGVFLSLVALGMLLGWGSAKRLFTGIFTPELQSASGITIRTTPEHTLWIATHTQGLTLNPTCPIDLPTLLSYKTTSWIILGDTETDMQTVIMGDIPTALKNYKTAFGCSLTPLKNGYTLQKPDVQTPKLVQFFPLHTPDGWAWQKNLKTTLNLYNRGINIALPYQPEEKISWPEQTLTTALPITPTSLNTLPETWQGLTILLQKGKGQAYFTWQTENGTATAISFSAVLTDDELLALFSVIAETPTKKQKIFREDNTSYIITLQDPLSLVWVDDTFGEARTEDGTTLGYVLREEDKTLVSTDATTWTSITPHWEASLEMSNRSNAHTPHTIANFGERIFITKNLLTVFQKKM